MSTTVQKKKLKPNEHGEKHSLRLCMKYDGNSPVWESLGLYSGVGKNRNIEHERLADDLAQKRHIEIIEGRHQLVRMQKDILLFDVIDELALKKSLEQQEKYRQVKIIIQKIFPSAEKMRVTAFTEIHVKKWMAHYKSTYAETTLERHINFLKGIFKFGIKQKYIFENPFEGVSFKASDSHKEFLEVDEFWQFFDFDVQTYISSLPSARYRMDSKMQFARDMFVFSCLTGLRISDTKTIRNEIDIKNKQIAKRMQKTGEMVYVPLLDEAYNILLKYEDGKFPDISNNKANKSVQTISALAGIKKRVTYHTSRHTFVCLLLASGIDVFHVQKLCGHKLIETTLGYAKMVSKSAEEAMDKFNDYLMKDR